MDCCKSANAIGVEQRIAIASRRSARRASTSRFRVGKAGDDILDLGIDRLFTTDDIREQLRILELEERLERLLFFFRGDRVPSIEVSLQQDIELAHAPTAAPFEARELAGRQMSRGAHGINAGALRSFA